MEVIVFIKLTEKKTKPASNHSLLSKHGGPNVGMLHFMFQYLIPVTDETHICLCIIPKGATSDLALPPVAKKPHTVPDIK